MAIKTASNRRAEAASAVSSQSVVINTGSGLSTYSATAGTSTIGSGGGSGPAITSVAITDNNYNVLDDTAVNILGNSFIKITGTNFQSTANVWVAGAMIPKANVTFVSSSELRVALSPNALGATTLSVFNSNSSGAIYSSILNFSTFPTWTTGATLANVLTNTTFGINLVASSDSTITYANTTALPPGTSLASNGYFSGTVTTGSVTTYSFAVDAKDAENQDVIRTFSMTVILVIPPGLYSWGYNRGGLGQNDIVNRSSPTQVGVATNWSQVSTNAYNTAAIKTDGTLWAWGNNQFNQLGTGDGVYRSSPVQLGALTTWSKVSVSAGGFNTAAIKTNGTLWAWGRNVYGELGTNDQGYRVSPVQIGALTTWSLVSMGGYITLATKTDGTLWAWGSNFQGALGKNDAIMRSSPVQIGSGTTWSKVSASGIYGVLATKTDGTLWAWGYNNYGQLGTGDVITRSSPVQIGSGTTWSLVSAGYYSMMAVKTDGTLWSWGDNYFGQLGLNATNPYGRSSPTQVGVGTTWSKVSAGQNNALAIKTDGTLWVWGHNNYGALGLGDLVYRSSPVQLGTGTTWSQVSTTNYSMMAILN